MRLLYQQLTDHLLKVIPAHYHAQFYSWMEDGKIINEGGQMDEAGETLFYLNYTAEFLFSELPYQEIDPLHLIAHFNDWVTTHDHDRCRLNQIEIPFDLTIIDDKTADLSFTLEVQEPIQAVKNEAGNLALIGGRYQLDSPEIWQAVSINQARFLS